MQSGLLYQLTIDGVIAVRGGVPLLKGGKLIGVSGGAGSQDEICAEAGAATVN